MFILVKPNSFESVRQIAPASLRTEETLFSHTLKSCKVRYESSLLFLHVLQSEVLTTHFFFFFGQSFQGYLYNEQPWETEIISSSRAKAKHV